MPWNNETDSSTYNPMEVRADQREGLVLVNCEDVSLTLTDCRYTDTILYDVAAGEEAADVVWFVRSSLRQTPPLCSGRRGWKPAVTTPSPLGKCYRKSRRVMIKDWLIRLTVPRWGKRSEGLKPRTLLGEDVRLNSSLMSWINEEIINKQQQNGVRRKNRECILWQGENKSMLLMVFSTPLMWRERC